MNICSKDEKFDKIFLQEHCKGNYVPTLLKRNVGYANQISIFVSNISSFLQTKFTT